MESVRAGVVSGRRTLLYGALGVVLTAAVTVGVTWAFGSNRVITGVLLGALVGGALLALLFQRDVVLLADHAIYRRTPWSTSSVAWERVVAGRFALNENARWTLALDLDDGDEPHHELVLLTIPPVERAVANAFEHRKREQVVQIRNMLRHKKIPVTVLPGIATALTLHWKLTPPTR